MSDGGNSLFVVDRELGNKWRVAYWSEHTVGDLLRRLRPERADLYELVHEEHGNITEDRLLMDLPLRRDAVLTLRERRFGGSAGLSPLTVTVAYTSASRQEVTGERGYNVAQGLTVLQFLEEILPGLPDPGNVDLLYWEIDGVLLPPATTLAEILAKDGAKLTLRNRLHFKARFGDQIKPFTAHPTFAVGKLLEDMKSGKMGESYRGKSLVFHLDGKQLPADQTLAQCGVRNGALLDLTVPGAASPTGPVRDLVQFLLVGDVVGQPEKSVQRGAVKVAEFVRELAIKYRKPAEQCRLLVNGVPLGSEAMLGAVVRDGAEVRLEVVADSARRVATPAPIAFELFDAIVGKPRPVNVPGTATVQELLATMSAKLGVGLDGLAIELDGARLGAKVQLGAVVAPGASVRLVASGGTATPPAPTPPPPAQPRPAPGPLPAKLAFELFDSIVSKPRPVDVPGSLLVRDLLQTMADKHKRPVGELFLELAGVRLPNEVPLGSLVKSGDKVHLGAGPGSAAAGGACRLPLPDGRAIAVSGAEGESLDAALRRAADAHGLRGRLSVLLNGQPLSGNTPAAHLPAYASNPAIRLELRLQA